MAAIQKIIDINKRELENNVSDSASWHADYSDTSYIYVGYLPIELEEKDILAIFSQYGNPTHLNLIRDRETGKSRGFCYLKYEDFRSCVLAIDNFNGIKVWDKRIKVDHVYYKLREGQNEDDFKVHYEEAKQIEEKQDIKLLEYDKVDKTEPTNDMKDDDEFKDPMAAYIESKDKRRHRHRDHKSSGERKHRSRHEHRRHRDDNRERSPNRSP